MTSLLLRLEPAIFLPPVQSHCPPLSSIGNILHAGLLFFSCFCCYLLTFFKIDFFKKFFQEYYQSGKHSVGPDLGPNCLQRLSAEV